LVIVIAGFAGLGIVCAGFAELVIVCAGCAGLGIVRGDRVRRLRRARDREAPAAPGSGS
jgi:hypothetical protein